MTNAPVDLPVSKGVGTIELAESGGGKGGGKGGGGG